MASLGIVDCPKCATVDMLHNKALHSYQQCTEATIAKQRERRERGKSRRGSWEEEGRRRNNYCSNAKAHAMASLGIVVVVAPQLIYCIIKHTLHYTLSNNALKQQLQTKREGGKSQRGSRREEGGIKFLPLQ